MLLYLKKTKKNVMRHPQLRLVWTLDQDIISRWLDVIPDKKSFPYFMGTSKFIHVLYLFKTVNNLNLNENGNKLTYNNIV